MQRENECKQEFIIAAQMGRLTRRQILHRGLALGLSSPLIASLLAACGDSADDDDEVRAAETTTTNTSDPVVLTPTESKAEEKESTPTSANGRALSDNRTFMMVYDAGVTDVDPHSAYWHMASNIFLATYEMLLRLDRKSVV